MGSEVGDTAAERAADDPDLSLDTPNCDVCLHRMEPAETESGTPFWHCAHCGAARVA